LGISKNYLFAFVFAPVSFDAELVFAAVLVLAAVFVFADEFTFAFDVFTTAFAFVFATFASTFVFAVFASVLAGCVVSVLEDVVVDKTEMSPVIAGIARSRADNINTQAAVIVILDKTVAVPRGPKALLDTLLVKSAPASVLPG